MDRLGSVRDIANWSAAVQDHLDYTGFRVLTESNSSVGDYNKYDSYHFISAAGMYLVGARTYDPSTGRWGQLDPIGFDAGQANLYQYAANDPTNATDPSGLQAPMRARLSLEAEAKRRLEAAKAIQKAPWKLSANWKNATGSMTWMWHRMQINWQAVTQAQGDKLIASIWGDLKAFKGFNEGNIATVRLIPRPKTDEVYAEFRTVDAEDRMQQSAVSGDGPDGEVYVRLFFDDKEHKVMAVTLGNHMIVGVRVWQLRIGWGEAAPGKPRELMVSIETLAEEQRNNIITNVGFAVKGRKNMIAVWNTYLTNLVNNAVKAGKNLGIRGTPDVRRFDVRIINYDRTRNMMAENVGLLPKEYQQPK
jgi:RHS repeat-associated protein